MSIRPRPIPNQRIHDNVIDRVVSALNPANYRALTNKGVQKNWRVGTEYPDVIVTSPSNGTVVFIIEVETQESVNEDEAKNQWLTTPVINV